jgi:type I restriction enzyme S subunit
MERIVSEAQRRMSLIEEVERQLETNLNRADRLRQAILKRAFDGKLVSQDSNDEPADVLLERIRGTANPGCAPTRGKGNNRSRRGLISKEAVHV